MDHDVLIDQEHAHAELAELAAAGDATTPDAPPGEAPAPAPEPMDWRMVSAGAVLVVDKVIAPNWCLESDEKDALAEGLDMVLRAFFPAAHIDPRVQALLTLGGIAVAIVGKRIDLDTRTLKPLRAPQAQPAEDASDTRAAA